MEKINFNVELKDAFNNVIKEGEKGNEKSVLINHSLVYILTTPHSIPEGKSFEPQAVVERLLLQQKLAREGEQDYSTDELAIIRDAVITMFNKKMLSVELAGTILQITA